MLLVGAIVSKTYFNDAGRSYLHALRSDVAAVTVRAHPRRRPTTAVLRWRCSLAS